MKDRKRLIIYSLLAVPFAAFGLYFMSLDAATRAGFLTEFRGNTKEMFRSADEIPPSNDGSAEPAAAANQAGRGGGGGRRGGGPDPGQLFAERDADGDGKLTGDEISERMQENLAQMDKDQDGSITLEELQDSMGGRRRGGGGRGGFGPAQIFQRRDEDGDGQLTGDEIGNRLRESLGDIDKDGDDAITLEELEAGFEQMRANFGGGRGGRNGRPGATDGAARPERQQRPE